MAAKVLIVDDEPYIRDMLQHVLENAGYEIYSAESSEKAWPVIQKVVPDLIITDVWMPGASGYELCQRVLKDYSPGIILMSAFLTDPELLEEIDLGSDQVIVLQ